MADPYEEYVKANLMSDRRLPTGSSRLGSLFDLEGPESGGQFFSHGRKTRRNTSIFRGNGPW